MRDIIYVYLLAIFFGGCASFVSDSTEIRGCHDCSDNRNLGAASQSFVISIGANTGGTEYHFSNRIASKRGNSSLVDFTSEIEAYISTRLVTKSHKCSQSEQIEFRFKTREAVDGISKIWLWSSSLTMSIFPYWGTGIVELNVIELKNGKEVSLFSSFGKYKRLQHILLLPLIFKSAKDAKIYIAKMLIDEYIEKMSQGLKSPCL